MALEFVGGALLSAFLQVAFEKLASPQALDFFRRRKLDQKLIGKLEIKLHSIHALANDAEHKQFIDPHVRKWLLKVKDAVLDAEDLLDEIQYELSKYEAESESQTCTGCSSCKVPNFFKSSPVSSFNSEIKSRMEQVLEDLEYLASQSGDLGLKQASGVGVGSGSQSIVSQKLPSTYLVAESVIFGRDDDKEMVFNWLISYIENQNKLSILSIVGMGGVGKTTLAQHVYNDRRIEDKFDIKAWVCVSDDFDVFKVTKTILEAFIRKVDDSVNLQMVHRQLKKLLKEKKFLLVLDDVWNEKREEWEAVQTPLNFGIQGSRIIVTTRSTKVASIMRSEEYQLKQLQQDYCWKLFAEHAFHSADHQSNPGFKDIGMKIVEKCKGLPLALKTMGSLLHKKSISQWESVLQSEIWELEDSNIVPALALSYHHLPSHLKRCFAYCALFPKGYVFKKLCLIQFWMAQNFLQYPQQSKCPEEVGEQYFNDLLSRSFFQQSSNVDGIDRFVMHDLLNDLAKYVCGDICFRLEVDQAKSIPKATRHFSVTVNHIEYFDGFPTFHDTKRLRTFMSTTVNHIEYFDGFLTFHDTKRLRTFMSTTEISGFHCKMLMDELSSKCKFLRVLSLCHYSNLTEVPESIANLKHLRSLDLSNNGIKNLPESTCSLYNLQILKLNSCWYLKELPLNLHKLANLRHLELIGTELRKVPAHLGKLKNLQVLMSSFVVGKNREFGIQQLGGLNLHGRLSIQELHNIVNPSDALAVDLKNKKHLVELELNWELNQKLDVSMKEKDVIVIENLRPSKHLESLSIRNYGGTRFPSWLFDNSLLNVVSLKLYNCQSCRHLPSLGLLPFLKDLRISGVFGVVGINVDFYGSSSSSFVSLETLRFTYIEEWENWECQAITGAFPCLQLLSIRCCPKLKGHLPVQLLRLKTLDIHDCKELIGNDGMLKFDGKKLFVEGHSIEAWLCEWIGKMISDVTVEHLFITSCPNMNIPMCHCYDFLVTLTMSGSCDSLTTFLLDFFPALRSLELSGCRNLKMISQECTYNQLKDVKISECPQLESLHILLPSFEMLQINDCPEVEWFSDGGLPSNLKEMELNNCSKFMASLKGALAANLSLKTLDIERLDVESFPDEGLLPPSLTCLWISDCPNLKKLDYKGLCHLSSLKELVLDNCPRLECLPEEGMPKSISTLKIWGNSPLIIAQKPESCQKHNVKTDENY